MRLPPPAVVAAGLALSDLCVPAQEETVWQVLVHSSVRSDHRAAWTKSGHARSKS